VRTRSFRRRRLDGRLGPRAAASHRILLRERLRHVLLRLMVGDGAGALARQADRGCRAPRDVPAGAPRAGDLHARSEAAAHRSHSSGVRRPAGIFPDAQLRSRPRPPSSTPSTASSTSCAWRPMAARHGSPSSRS
jgi:hypothetical protein